MEHRTAPTFIEGLPLANAAFAYARELHRGQTRDSDEAPFILHPLEVASLLQTTGHDEDLIAAAILHDSVERTPIAASDIAGRFGDHVAGIVAAMTEDASAPPERRRVGLRRQVAAHGDGAIAVFAADKVAKVRELRAEAVSDPQVIAEGRDGRARLDHYLASLALLEDEAPKHPLVGQLRFELEALHMLPPRSVEGALAEDGASAA